MPGLSRRSQFIAGHHNPGRQDEEVDSRTRLRLGAALVYADGQLAISRPVRDSFAIVTPHPQLEGHKIGVELFATDTPQRLTDGDQPLFRT